MKKTASVYIPHYGCPNDCIFCNQVKISGKKTNLDYVAMKNDILTGISTMKDDDIVEIAFFGGSFTAIESEVQEECLSLANEIGNQIGKDIQIKLSTRPDAIDEQVIARLEKYNVHTVELGVQSMDDEVLELNNRGHDSSSVYRAAELIQNTDIKLGLQIMIGLYGDTREKLYQTIDKVVEIKPDIARIYPVLVIKDTMLEQLYYDKKYIPIDLDLAVEYAKDMYARFENVGINVIRIGLQATNNINVGNDVIAGPFHPAFGELVIGALYRDKIEKIIINSNYKEKTLEIFCPKRQISQIIGNKKANIKYFKDKYSIDIKVREGKTTKILNEELEWKDFLKL